MPLDGPSYLTHAVGPVGLQATVRLRGDRLQGGLSLLPLQGFDWGTLAERVEGEGGPWAGQIGSS